MNSGFNVSGLDLTYLYSTWECTWKNWWILAILQELGVLKKKNLKCTFKKIYMLDPKKIQETKLEINIKNASLLEIKLF